MMFLLAVLNILLIGWIFFLLWRKEQRVLKKYFLAALFIKMMAGIGLGLVYTYYYTVGDTFIYFDDGKKLAALARTDIGSYISFLWSGDESFSIWSDLVYKQPRAAFLSKVTSLFCLLTHDNYWIISLYYSGIAFVGAWLLVKTIITFYPVAQIPALLSFLFFPSVVFWSSGVIKESLAMAGLFYLCRVFLKWWEKHRLSFSDLLFTALSLWIVWNLKYYYLAIYLPVVATALIVRFLVPTLNVTSLFMKVALWLFVFTVPLLIVSSLHPNFYPGRLAHVVVDSYYEFQAISSSEDLIHYTSLEPTAIGIARNIPWALVSGLFRPTLFEVHNILQIFIALENTMLIILLLTTLKAVKSAIQSEHRLLLFSMLIYVLLLCIFLALSTPNFGTLSRYRVGFLPFLVLLLTMKNPLINTWVKSNANEDLVP